VNPNAEPVEEKRARRLDHIRAQVAPRITLSEDVLRKALGAVTAILYLDRFENEFVHALKVKTFARG